MRRRGIAFVVLGLVWALAPAARGEVFLQVYGGKQISAPSDVTLRQPDRGNDFTFRSVSLEDRSFAPPLYYGVRAGYFFKRFERVGVGLEMIHEKLVADTTQVRPLAGVVGGQAVHEERTMTPLVERLSLTHGNNLFFLEGLARHGLWRSDAFQRGRLQLYGGVGLGPVIVHPEVTVDGLTAKEGWQWGGLGLQLFLGAKLLLLRHLGMFAELKGTRSHPTFEVAEGSGELDEASFHAAVGLCLQGR